MSVFKGEESGLAALQSGCHGDLFVAHRKVHQTPFELETRAPLDPYPSDTVSPPPSPS